VLFYRHVSIAPAYIGITQRSANVQPFSRDVHQLCWRMSAPRGRHREKSCTKVREYESYFEVTPTFDAIESTGQVVRTAKVSANCLLVMFFASPTWFLHIVSGVLRVS
jgi:hypothetical protein